MKEEGNSTPAPAGPPTTDEPVQRTIQAAPGDVTSSRPVTEPSDTTKR
jgi:sec-independent protein translocase protein TatA